MRWNVNTQNSGQILSTYEPVCHCKLKQNLKLWRSGSKIGDVFLTMNRLISNLRIEYLRERNELNSAKELKSPLFRKVLKSDN